MKRVSHLSLFVKLTALTAVVGLSAFPSTSALAEVESRQPLFNAPANSTKIDTYLAQTRNVGNLVEVAKENENLSTFAAAVEAADLDTTLSGSQNYTVFAPTNDAFEALPSGTVDALLKPENKPLLRQVLTYHVVQGKQTASDLRSGGLNTVGGGVAINTSDSGVVVNDARVTEADIEASNGVIHTVNRVLLPRNLRVRVLALTQTRTTTTTPQPIRALW
ncbi:fasciclin domain-containing protein [Oscillatoria salina]|uniref:fasciclin domain-containing protein n=1 Tax=Oscillatoria salina TaxID=331517 RepID=UPI0013B9D484|nr:fasciclin domain-containing protein [Oscillatoria salina]MBZ8181197.1 fasciclin domain-containing protein [Oscillatoria salina IIICB1]NET88650.1 fasciclin domain-containing protein [Kamptonema sp. SIO1D9]